MKTSITATIVWITAAAALSAAPAPDSQRLARAKDDIADEQWTRAVAELQAAVDDRKEPNRDEAMYWLAESQHELGDLASAIQTINRLEREFPASRWVHPARSLTVEIAQRMRRDDLLWVMATPPPTPAAAPPAPGPAPEPMTHYVVAPRALAPTAVPAARPAPHPAAPAPALMPAAPAPVAVLPGVSEFWASPAPDTDLQIEALGGLLNDHAARAIPLLKEIALDPERPNEARRAVFVLGQSSQPEARLILLQVATTGAGSARVAAIRQLGQFKGPSVNGELMRVYAAADSPSLKRQVVTSLGERADTPALMKIATTEPNVVVRDAAILTLGKTAARMQLRMLYGRSDAAARPVVLSALFNAKDDEGLIEIVRTEKDAALRQRAVQQLRILATPKAVAFLDDTAR